MSDFSIRFDALSPLSKRVLVKALLLSESQEGVCYASDEFLVKELRVSRSSLRLSLSDCLNKGFLSSITAFGSRNYKVNRKTSSLRSLVVHCSKPDGWEKISNMEGVVSGLNQIEGLPPSDCSYVENSESYNLLMAKIQEEPFVRPPFITVRGALRALYPLGNPDCNKGGRPKGSVKRPKAEVRVVEPVSKPEVKVVPPVASKVTNPEIVDLIWELGRKIDSLGTKVDNGLTQLDKKIVNLDVITNIIDRKLDFKVNTFTALTEGIDKKVDMLAKVILDTDPDVQGPTDSDIRNWVEAWKDAKLKAKYQANTKMEITSPLALTGLDNSKVAVEPVVEAASDEDQYSYSDESSFDEYDPEWEAMDDTEVLQFSYSDESSFDDSDPEWDYETAPEFEQCSYSDDSSFCEFDPEFTYCFSLVNWEETCMKQGIETPKELETESSLIDFDDSVFFSSAESFELAVNYDCDVKNEEFVLPTELASVSFDDLKNLNDEVFSMLDEPVAPVSDNPNFAPFELKPLWPVPEREIDDDPEDELAEQIAEEKTVIEETQHKTLDKFPEPGYNPGRLFDETDDSPEAEQMNYELTSEEYALDRDERLENGWRRIWGHLQLEPGETIVQHWIAKNCEINKSQEYSLEAMEEILGRAYMSDGQAVVPMYLLGVYKFEVKIEDAYPEEVAKFVKEKLL